jgi:hypothetical protein
MKNIKNIKKFILVIFIVSLGNLLFGAVGCDLNDPDRDVNRLFPNSTGYKTIYFGIDKYKDADKVYKSVQEKLGDKFAGIYETIDVPYTVYEIYKSRKKIGYIHGINQKGTYGGIQVFLALNLDGTIIGFYIQKLTSKYAKEYRTDYFYNQFLGLNLKDFEDYDVVLGTTKNNSKVSKIKNPVLDNEKDFQGILRATKKNLILIQKFVFENL